MKHFSRLFSELDATTSTNEKVEALTRYFDAAPPRDAAWAVYFLAGGKPRQVVKTAALVHLACEAAEIAPWLFDECYQAVGDLAETIALVLPVGNATSDTGLAEWVETVRKHHSQTYQHCLLVAGVAVGGGGGGVADDCASSVGTAMPMLGPRSTAPPVEGSSAGSSEKLLVSPIPSWP